MGRPGAGAPGPPRVARARIPMDESPNQPAADEAATIPPRAHDGGQTLNNLAPLTGSPADPGAAHPAVPPQLADHPRYRVVALLGRGGMGAVYKAEHRRMERAVALKVISPALVNHPSTVQRFQQEVRAAARLHHPHIVTAYDADQAGDLHFLVMEFVEGETLSDCLQRRGPLPPAEACEYVRQAALGLQHAHEHGMVHRDVKPHNLMRTPDGRIKILDFGLARLGEAADVPGVGAAPDGGGEATQLTAAGSVMGTADYIAPEQADDSHRADIRSDIYSLGCTLYHLLTGRTPFAGGSAIDKVVRHAAEQPDAPAKLRRGLPAGLSGVILKMMAKDPARRYQTPADVARALAPFASRPRRLWPLFIGAAVVGLAVGAAVYWAQPWRHKRQEAPPRPAVPDPAALAARAGAADALSRADLPDAALALAGGGDPAQAPPSLVAVLGDAHFRLYGQTGFPAFSPRGDRLAVPSGSDVLVFDAETGRVTHTLLGHADRVSRVAFSPDGRWIASAARDRTFKLWDAAGGSELPCPVPAELCSPYPAFAFGPDGTLAVADAEGGVHLFDCAARKETASLPDGPDGARGIAFRPDGKAVAAASPGAVRVWDLADRAAPKKLTLPRPAKSADDQVALAFSADSQFLAAGAEGAVHIWDAESLGERWHADTPAAGLTAFSADGKTLFTAARRPERARVVRRWRAEDGAPEGDWAAAGEGGVALYALRPDGKALAAGAYSEPVVRLHDAETGAPRFPGTGHVAPVHAAAFSPDGKTLATAGGDRVVKVWDVASASERLTLQNGKEPVTAVAFSPDGATLAAGDAGGAVRLWDAADGKLVHEWIGDPGGVQTLAYSPDGKTLASGGLDHAAHLWDPATGGEKSPPLQADDNVNAVAFNPDGRTLATGGDGQMLAVWDAASGRKLRAEPRGEAVRGMAFLPDGMTLATGGPAGDVALLGAEAGETKGTLSGSTSALARLAVRADGRLIAAGCGDGAVRLWDPADPSRRAAFWLGPAGTSVEAVALGPEGRCLAAAGPDGTVCLFRLADRGVVYEPPAAVLVEEPHRLAASGQPASSGRSAESGVGFEPDGVHVLTCGPDNRVRRWNADDETAAGEPSAPIRNNAGPVVFLPGGRLLSGGRDGRLRLWDYGAGQPVYEKPGHRGEITAMAATADGRFALTGGDDHTARLWDVGKGELLRAFQGHDKPVRAAAVWTDGARWALLTAGADGNVYFWDRDGSEPRRVVAGGKGGPGGLCVSPDGRRAAWGGDDGLVHVWDLGRDEEALRLALRDGPLRAIGFSPDGGRLLAVGQRGVLALWDASTGRTLDRTLCRPASSLAFSPDGGRVVLGGDDAAAHLWRLR